MKNKKNILIILTIILVLVTISAIIFNLNKENTNNTSKNEVNNSTGESGFMGVGGDMTYEEFYDWETKLNQKLFALFAEEYPESYKFNLKEGEVFRVTLAQLQNKYRKDISDFNTDTIKCDIHKSAITVKVDSEYGFLREAMVVCENSEEK